MPAPLKIRRDVGSLATNSIDFTADADGFSLLLGVDTDATVTVPADSRIALFAFQPGASVWVDEAVITVPTTDVAVANSKQLNPGARNVESITTLHFRSNAIAYVWVGFYR